MKLARLALIPILTGSCSLRPIDDLSEPSADAGDGNALCPRPGWCELPGTHLQSVCPPKTSSFDYPFYCKSVVRSPNSGAADILRNRLLIWGAFPTYYYGNEMYALDLATQQLTRLDDPSPLIDPGATVCPPMTMDGKPTARLTWDAVTQIDETDELFAFGGDLACPGVPGEGLDTWTRDFGTMEWSQKLPGGTGAGPPTAYEYALADSDRQSQTVFVHTRHALWAYHYDSNTYQHLIDNEITYAMTGRVDPKRRLFVAMGSKGYPPGGLKVYDISAPDKEVVVYDWTDQATGCDALLASPAPGLAWDPRVERLVGWPDFGNTVYLFDPDTKSCEARTFEGGPPNSHHSGDMDSSNGTRGRWRYFPQLDLFAVVNDWDIDAFVLRLGP